MIDSGGRRNAHPPLITLAHGIDLVECERVARILARHHDRFLERVLTELERRNAGRYQRPIPHLAGRFAAKEAVLKMLGTGWRGQISWQDIEITNDELGRPQVALRDECARVADEKGIAAVLLSISHTAHHATASAIGLGPVNAERDG